VNFQFGAEITCSFFLYFSNDMEFYSFDIIVIFPRICVESVSISTSMILSKKWC